MRRVRLKKLRAVKLRPRAEGDGLPDAKDFDQDFSHIRNDRKMLREKFVREYIKDFNGTEAMRRLGYRHSAVNVHAAKFLRDPYTQWFLRQLLDKLDEKAIVNRNMVLSGLLKEANARGYDDSHSARVSAWRTLGRILGMEITKVEGNLNVNGGVMAVPFTGSLEDWEKQTQAAQAKLKEDVRK